MQALANYFKIACRKCEDVEINLKPNNQFYPSNGSLSSTQQEEIVRENLFLCHMSEFSRLGSIVLCSWKTDEFFVTVSFFWMPFFACCCIAL